MKWWISFFLLKMKLWCNRWPNAEKLTFKMTTLLLLDGENKTSVAFAELSLTDGISSLMSRINSSISTDRQRKIEWKYRKSQMSRNYMKPKERYGNMVILKIGRCEAEVRRSSLWDNVSDIRRHCVWTFINMCDDTSLGVWHWLTFTPEAELTSTLPSSRVDSC